MVRKNSSCLEGFICSVPKVMKLGEKKNFTRIFFMLSWEGEEKTSKAGKKWKPSVKMPISVSGKLCDAYTHLKEGDLIRVSGQLLRDSKTDEKTKMVTYFYKIEADIIEELTQPKPYTEMDEEMPW